MNNPALTVTQLNTYVKSLLDSDRNLRSVSVRGEISNFVRNTKSGHMYFRLKDSESAVECVMFRSYADRLSFLPKDGVKVNLRGRVSLYPRDGAYQIYAEEMIEDGLGSVYMAFLRLKETLGKEGLFHEEYKKDIPPFPQRVGVATSETGAALQDILNISGRRFPCAEIVLYPCIVQGEGSSGSVCRAIEYFNRTDCVDVIIVARGGGAYEDLASFNDEILARTVFASHIPVVSGVGHEIDTTIIDLVSDVCAPTPSAAAEMVFPDGEQLSLYLNGLVTKMEQHLAVRTDSAQTRLDSAVRRIDLTHFLENLRLRLNMTRDRLFTSGDRLMAMKEHSLVTQAKRIQALDPMSVLLRGFSVVYKDGKTVNSVRENSNVDKLKIRMKDGVVDCVSEKTGNDL